MQELEKILKEIDEEKKHISLSPDYSNEYAVAQILMAEKIEKIIRKHMNDGWIPVERGLPEEDGFYIATMDGEIVGQEEPFVGLAEFEDGNWVDGDDVIAWRPLPEPYRPERSEE